MNVPLPGAACASCGELGGVVLFTVKSRGILPKIALNKDSL